MGLFLFLFFGQEVFDVFYGAHGLGGEDDGAVLFAGNFGQGLQVAQLQGDGVGGNDVGGLA
jgi:hypothetical protein